jgi:hypothetical protein
VNKDIEEAFEEAKGAMKYACKVEGCNNSAQTCSCACCNEPWLFDCCSEKCWESIPLVKRLQNEEDTLCSRAAQRIEILESSLKIALTKIKEYNDNK